MSRDAGAAPRSLSLVQAAVVLLVLWAALCWPWFLGGLTVPWDAKNHFYPQLRFLAAALHDGQTPAWAPYVYSGHPQLADPQSLIFSPPMLALAALDAAPTFARMDGVVLAWLLVGGLGLLLMFRERGWRLEGGLIAALAFMFGGTAATRLQHTGIILSYAMLPVALWLLTRALARCSIASALGAGIAAAVMATGRDQIAFLGCLVLGGYVVCALCDAPQRIAYLKSRALPLAIAAVTGAAVLAIPLLLTAELAAMSSRAAISYQTAAPGSLTPWTLVTFLAPDYFGTLGSIAGYWGPGAFAWGVYDNQTDRAINYLYSGAAPALLFLWHGIAGRRLWAREVRFFLVVLALALLYALGHYTPVFRAMFELPGVSLYRRPADATFIVGFALAFLGGYFVHRLLAEGLPRVSRVSAIVVAAVVAAALVAALALASTRGQLEIAGRAVLWAAGFMALAAAALWLAVRWRAAPALAVAPIALVLALDLARHNAGTPVNARDPAEYAELDPRKPNALATYLKERIAADRAAGMQPRVEILGLGGPWQNAPLIFGLEATLGYNPVRVADYQRASGAGEGSHLPRRDFTPLFASYRSRLADLLGLRYIVLGAPIETLDPKVKPGDFTLLRRFGATYVYENPRALPRARFVAEIVVMDTQRLIETGAWPTADPRHATVLDRKPPEWRNTVPMATAANAATVAIERYRNDEVTIAVNADRAGMLVLHDRFHPGWRAAVDGAPAAIYRADALFRAVYVPQGRHVVRFTYHPLADVVNKFLLRSL